MGLVQKGSPERVDEAHGRQPGNVNFGTSGNEWVSKCY